MFFLRKESNPIFPQDAKYLKSFLRRRTCSNYKLRLNVSRSGNRKKNSQDQHVDMGTATRFKGGCQGEPSNLGGQWEQSNKLGLGVACVTSLYQLVPSIKTTLQDANCTCMRSVNTECSGRQGTHLCTHCL